MGGEEVAVLVTEEDVFLLEEGELAWPGELGQRWAFGVSMFEEFVIGLRDGC